MDLKKNTKRFKEDDHDYKIDMPNDNFSSHFNAQN